MPKFVDKMNLPQYRYFHDMTVREEERQDIVSDFFTAQHQLNNGDQRGYRDGLILLGRVRSRLPDFLYAQDEDRKKCRMDMEAKNIRVQMKKMEKPPVFPGPSPKAGKIYRKEGCGGHTKGKTAADIPVQ